jgi:hypothetical protein
MRITKLLAVLAATSMAAMAGAASASAAHKPKPKPRIHALLTTCLHTWGTWEPVTGRQSNGMAVSVRAKVANKGLGGARVALNLTGPDVLNAGGAGTTVSSPATQRGAFDAGVPGLPIFGTDGLYRLSWSVTKKGYAPATGHLDFQAHTGMEPWYGGYKSVVCEGWTQPLH